MLIDVKKNLINEYTTSDVKIGGSSCEVVFRMDISTTDVEIFRDSACVFSSPIHGYDWYFGFTSAILNGGVLVGCDKFSSSLRMEEIPSYQTIAQGVLGLSPGGEIMRRHAIEFSFNQDDMVD